MKASYWGAVNASYKEAEIKEGEGFTPFPEGTHQARIVLNRLDEEKGIIERQYEGVSGEILGRKNKTWIYLVKKNGYANDGALGIIRNEIAKFDFDLAQIDLSESILPYCEGSLDKLVEIFVQHKQGVRDDGAPSINVNIYINKFLDIGNEATEEELPF